MFLWRKGLSYTKICGKGILVKWTSISQSPVVGNELGVSKEQAGQQGWNGFSKGQSGKRRGEGQHGYPPRQSTGFGFYPKCNEKLQESQRRGWHGQSIVSKDAFGFCEKNEP